MKRGVGWLMFICAVVLPAVTHGQGHEIPPLQPPHGELAPTYWEQHGWLVLTGAALLLLGLFLFIVWLRHPKQVIPEPPGIVARRALESWRNRPENGALVADVSRVIRRYVMAAFNFTHDELTTTEFRDALQSNIQIAPELAAATGDFLRRCDQWKFAPNPPTPKLGAVTSALELVDKLEMNRAENQRKENVK